MQNKQTKLKETEIGLIPEDWEVLELENAIDFDPARAIKKDKEVRFVAMTNIDTFDKKIKSYSKRNFSGGSKFKNGDTLLARITPCLENGKTAFCDILNDEEIAGGSTEFIILSGKSGKSDSNFVYYLAISPEFRKTAIQAMTGTSGRQRVQADKLKNHKIALPPTEEQQKIAGVLGALDDKIELNRKMNKTLESLGQAIFKQWFVEGENYRIGKLSDIADITTGKRPEVRSNEQTPEFSVPLIGAGSVMGYTAKTLYDDKDDIIVTGRVGTHGVLQRINYLCWPSDNTLVTCSGIQNFVHQTMQTLDFHSLNKGSTQPLITQTDLRNFEINIPPKEEIEKYEQIAQPMTDLINKNNKEIGILSQIRDSLLPRLMSGKLRVK